MQIVKSIDEAIRVKMEELAAMVEARQRMEDRALAVECGEDRTFWKDGYITIRKSSERKTIIRRREVV